MAEQPERPKINTFKHFQMWAEPINGSGQKPRLEFGIRDGQPRVSVFTNVPGDTQTGGAISASMNPETFFSFLEMLKRIAMSDKECKYCLECYTAYDPVTQKTTDTKILVSSIMFGRDADGIIWLSVIADNRPKIKFEFKPMDSDRNRFVTATGEALSDAECSTYRVLGRVDSLAKVYATFMAEFRQPKADSGSRNNSFGGNQSYQQAPKKDMNFDDNLSF